MSSILYLVDLTRFALRRNPIIFLALGVSILSVVLELAAMATLMPLAELSTGHALLEKDLFVTRVLSWLGIAPDAKHVLLLFLSLFTLRIITQFISQVTIFHTSRSLLHQLTTTAFQKLLTDVPIREVERESIGSYISLVGDESFRASTLFSNLSQLLTQLLLAGLYYYFIWAYSPATAIAVAVYLLVTLALTFNAFRLSHRFGHFQIEQSQAASSVFLDGLNGLRSVRTMVAEHFFSDRYRQLMRDYVKTLFRIDALNLITRVGPALLLLLCAAVFVLNPRLAGDELRDFAFTITLVIILMRFFPVVGQTLAILLRVVSDTRAGRDVTSLIRENPTTEVNDSQISTQAPLEKIALVDVSFSYLHNVNVLEKLNLTLHKGRSYAIIGRSGSGKSTLMDILLGFIRPDTGSVFVNDLPLGQDDTQSLRGRIVLVPQETTIFNDTVRDNISFGLAVTDEEIQRASNISQASDFINSLPLGLNTPLTYRGSNLSGGQRQRIGIARALVRRPNILLLDESTSALDFETRNALIKALKLNMKEGILVFVTHDPSVIESVDLVIDMQSVNVIEDANGSLSR
jgi:ABC-type bacteriocin/lantibiotic exporter with double-glycine peptidase domain